MRKSPIILLNMAVDVINDAENEVIISNYVRRVCDENGGGTYGRTCSGLRYGTKNLRGADY